MMLVQEHCPAGDGMLEDAGLAGVAGAWPLVGRDKEAAWLRERLGCGDAAVVAGPAGVGKTHLVRAVLNELEQAGWDVCWTWANACARQVPFAPFGSLHGGGPEDAAGRMESIVGRLAERAAAGRAVLAVDDAHLLDGASAAVVERLVRDRTLAVVGTTRQGEPAPDAVVALWSTGPAQRMELDRLGRPAVGQLVERVLGGPVAEELVDELWAVTAGNALHVREAMIASLEAGGLERVDGRWQTQQLVAAGRRLHEYVSSRIGRLPETVAEGLAVTALAEGLAWEVLETAVGEPVASELRQRGLVAPPDRAGGDVVQVAHPLYGETIRAQVAPQRQKQLARILIATLEARGPIEAEDLLRAAEIRLAVGDLSDTDLLVKAGQHAASVGYGPLGERLGRAALEAGGGVAARLVLATAIRQQGHMRKAETILAEGVDEAQTDQERTRLAIYRSISLVTRGEAAQAIEVLSEARTGVQDPSFLVDLDAQRSLLLMFLGRMEESVELSDRLPSDESLPVAVQIHVDVAKSAMAFRGRADRAMAVMRPWLTTRRDELLQVPEANVQLSLGACFTELLRWRLSAGIDMAASIIEDLCEQRAWSVAGDFTTIKAYGLLLSGRPRTARQALDDAQAMWDRAQPGLYQALALAIDQRISVLLADHDRAWAGLGQAQALRAEGANYPPMHHVDLGIAAMWVQVAAGHPEVSLDAGWDAVAFAHDGGDLMRECQALHSLARLGQPAEVVHRIGELVPRLDGPGWKAIGWHVHGLAYGSTNQLADAAKRFEQVGAWLLAAEAWAEAASAHTRNGDRRQAAVTRRRARTAQARCEDGRTPALRALAAPVLTPRQREIARLAAARMANAEIAQALTISVRTVENHLQRVYELLDISGRNELAEELQRSEHVG